MYKKFIAMCMTVVVSACTTLDSNSSFYDAIDSVEEKHSSLIIKAKPYAADATAVKGKDVMRNELVFTAGVSKRSELEHNFKIDLEVMYFKSYQLFTEVLVEGSVRPLKEYDPIVESCGEHCSIIQFLTFNITPEEFNKAASQGLSFDIKTSNDLTVIRFNVPAGYFKAVEEEITLAQQVKPNSNNIALASQDNAPANAMPKSQEMTVYWYEKASTEDKEKIMNWAFDNRSSADPAPLEGTKAVEMATYWFGTATEAEKKQILSWLLTQ
ncbi:hypothetical protein QTV44_003614 [Vibrio vulnificus]|nr:hypothetical protein [Vibrio vulnificus]